MKLLIITQKIDRNDDVLGFMHGWIAEFAKHCESVTAIALYVGEHDLPTNVKVLSLGKEAYPSKLKYLLNFFRYIINERRNYDGVFVHMNPEYVVLGGLFWKIVGKKIGLWYAHGHVPPMLQIAERSADMIFTSTESGMRMRTQKKRVVGQGIDTERFSLTERIRSADEPLRLIIVGRISPVKDYETLLRSAVELVHVGKNIAVDIVGGAGLPEQDVYLEKLKKYVAENNLNKIVTFHGAMANSKIGSLLMQAHCFVNTSNTGSFDKAVGEAMATGLPVLTSNEAFREVLKGFAPRLMFTAGDDKELTERILEILAMSDEERNELGRSLRELIERDHSLKNFVGKILSYY